MLDIRVYDKANILCFCEKKKPGVVLYKYIQAYIIIILIISPLNITNEQSDSTIGKLYLKNFGHVQGCIGEKALTDPFLPWWM